ncbi:hypothetical protein RSOLAG22IIIB_01295 [Rhizoctonia solani]|uniref:BTB domain-containing protein n=1 Tax=Rhizoctonia solani TaxID=456999 RepID=A0A0K6G577_9AGAM|nr:hypothetical protein RSOLAG22IIIB_01295 [Rhizoctonia solani]
MVGPISSLNSSLDSFTLSDAPTVVDLGDGDIELKVNNTIFKTHKHLLNDFGRLREVIKGMERYGEAPCISIYRDEHGVEDFKNMFQVLYASLIKGPFEFEAPVLVSSLRIATAYDYPKLREFSIDRLESAKLSAVQRIKLSGEFGLSSWDESAFRELASREEPLSKDEAREIGVDRFEEIVRAREEMQRRKGAVEEKVRRDEEERKRREEEERVKREEEEKKKREEEEKVKKEAEEKAKKQAEEKAK